MADNLHAMDYLDKPASHPARGVCVVFGDDAYLKRAVLKSLRKEVLGGEEGEFSLSVLAGKDAQLADVLDELATVSMFGPADRLVIIEEADEFVSKHRQNLEDYAAKEKHHGVLVLEVKTFPSTTKLAKQLAKTGLVIEGKTPPPARLKKWLTDRAKNEHGAKLDKAAVEMLLELVEPEVGLLEQEVARLALMTGDDRTITTELIQQHVGSWRTKTTWDMIDSVAEGNAKSALLQLDRLILAGEVPIALLGQIASTLRRFATATRLVERAEFAGRRPNLRASLEEAGFKPFVIGKAESQLKQIGRARGKKLHRWLLELDIALKGESSSPPRARQALEELIVQLSKLAVPKSKVG
jgi:DNA polymerase III subunit delta